MAATLPERPDGVVVSRPEGRYSRLAACFQCVWHNDWLPQVSACCPGIPHDVPHVLSQCPGIDWSHAGPNDRRRRVTKSVASGRVDRLGWRCQSP